MHFVNESKRKVFVIWLDFGGKRDSRSWVDKDLEPGESMDVNTTVGAPFVVTDEKQNALSIHYAQAAKVTVGIPDQAAPADGNGRKGVDLTGVKSQQGGDPVSVSFVNGMSGTVRVFWMDFDGKRDARPGAGDRLEPGQPVQIGTTEGSAFVVVNDKDEPIEVHVVSKKEPRIEIGKKVAGRVPAPATASESRNRKHTEELKKVKSKTGGAPTTLSFINNLKQPVHVRWIDFDGRRDPRPAPLLQPGKVTGMATTDGAVFVVTDENENALELHRADMNGWRVEIGGPIVDYAKPQRTYREVTKDGFTIQVEASLLEQDAEAAEKATARLAANVKKALEVYPPHSHAAIRSTRLYVMHGPKAAGGGRDDSIEYITKGQPDFIRSLDPKWHHTLVIYSGPAYARLSDMWALKATLHEFAHTYHLSNWPQEQPDINAAYRQAMDKGLYKNVKDTETGGIHANAYATTNGSEYFAELSACYFYRINYFPVNRDGLKQYDPDGYRLIEKMWKLGKD